MTNRVEISKILQSVKRGGNDHGQKSCSLLLPH